MKRINVLFFSVALALGLGMAQLPKALAEESGSSTNNVAGPKPSPEAEANMIAAIKEQFPDAADIDFKKIKSVGTNSVYAASFQRNRAQVAADGTLVETDEPSDITTFPAAANAAVRKAITGMGVKDNGVRLGKTYAEVRKNESGEYLAKLPQPVLTYRADVANNKGAPGEFIFNADGSAVDKPDWAE
jgi:hypothetical protein